MHEVCTRQVRIHVLRSRFSTGAWPASSGPFTRTSCSLYSMPFGQCYQVFCTSLCGLLLVPLLGAIALGVSCLTLVLTVTAMEVSVMSLANEP